MTILTKQAGALCNCEDCEPATWQAVRTQAVIGAKVGILVATVLIWSAAIALVMGA